MPDRSNSVAVYPGTFDPVTNGHLDIIKRARQIFPHLIVAVASHPPHPPLFDMEERIEMVQKATHSLPLPHLTVECLDGLLVAYARRKKARAIIRGMRAVSDFDYELQMAMINRRLDDRIETVFLVPSDAYTYLSSTLIKSVARYGGDVSGLVPKLVMIRLKEKFEGLVK